MSDDNKNALSLLIIVLVIVGGLVFYFKGELPFGREDGNINTDAVKNNDSGSGLDFVSGEVVGSVKSATLGEYLTDTKGMTLYVFADDKKLESSCTGTCLEMWPAFVFDNKDLKASTDTLSKRMNVIKRTDGTYQYAYGEKPVYYYAGDKNPGDTNGNGLNNGKWSIIVITR